MLNVLNAISDCNKRDLKKRYRIFLLKKCRTTKSYSKPVGPRFRSQFTPLYTTGRVIYFSLFDITIVQEFLPPPPFPFTLLAGVLFPTNLVSLISLNPVLFRFSVASLNVLSSLFRIVSVRSPFLSCSSRTQTISTSTKIL